MLVRVAFVVYEDGERKKDQIEKSVKEVKQLTNTNISQQTRHSHAQKSILTLGNLYKIRWCPLSDATFNVIRLIMFNKTTKIMLNRAFPLNPENFLIPCFQQLDVATLAIQNACCLYYDQISLSTKVHFLGSQSICSVKNIVI